MKCSRLRAMVVAVLVSACAARSENLLRNAGFESDDHTTSPDAYRQWVVASGSWHRRTGSPDPPSPAEGSYYYFPNDCTWATIYQQLDPTKLGLDAARMSTGGYYVDYSGRQCSWHEGGFSANDQGRIGLAQYAGFTLLDSHDLGWVAQSHTSGWATRSGSVRLDPATNRLLYVFDAQERDMWPGTINDAFLDDTHLYIRPSDIWTHGDTSASHYGAGDWLVTDALRIGDTSSGQLHVTGSVLTTENAVNLGLMRAGTVNIAGGTWTARGRVDVGWNGSVVNVGPAGRWTTAGLVSGAGTANVSGGTWDSSGPVNMGRANIGAGTWNSLGDVDLHATDISGGTWNSCGQVSVSTDLCMTGGTWNAMGTVNVWGDLRIAGGAMNVAASGLAPFRGTIHLEGGQLNISGDGPLPWDSMSLGNGTLTILGQMTALPDTLEIGSCRLVHANAPLNLAGAEIEGGGEILVGSSGVNLGTSGDPGRLSGLSAAERLTVYGDLSGSGTLTHVVVYGNVSVGNSAGQVSLENVLFGGGSTAAMEIFGVGGHSYDRMLIGPGVDFAGCPIQIDFAGGFAPQTTDTFDLFDELSGGDLPATLTGATIHVPIDWQLDVSTGTLSYVPEPTAVVLLALGGIAVCRRRLRRRRGGG